MPEAMDLVGFSGSLREGSLTTAVLGALGRLAPSCVSLEVAQYRDLPLFDADLRPPPSVQVLNQRVAQADGVLIVTPEYNYSIPGGLKNALDWLSRPAYQSVFAHKPVGVVSISAGPVGGARAQAHLKTVLGGMVAQVFPHPELAIGSANTRIEQGEVTDPSTEQLLLDYVNRFVAWARARSVSSPVGRSDGGSLHGRVKAQLA